MALKYVTYLIISIICIVLISGTAAYLNSHEAKKIFFSTVNSVDGNILTLADEGEVLLSGVCVPRKTDHNYSPQLEENIIHTFMGKRFKFKRVLNKNIRYPKYDLVNAYRDNGKCINAELLEKGLAFFDHGYYPGKDFYEKIEQKAKEQKLGVWQNKNLKVLFVTSRYWWDFHYPECPLTQKIKPRDRIEYYVWPTPIFFYRDPDIDCKYCREIEVKYNRPKLFTYNEQDYLEDVRKEKEAAKSKTLTQQ